MISRPPNAYPVASWQPARKNRRAPQRPRQEPCPRTRPEAIVDCAQDILEHIESRRKPSLKFPKRALSNVAYDAKEGYFKLKQGHVTRTLTYNTVKTFAQTLRMMALSKEAIKTDEEITKREAYYVSKNWGEARFDEQPESDTVMEDVDA